MLHKSEPNRYTSAVSTLINFFCTKKNANNFLLLIFFFRNLPDSSDGDNIHFGDCDGGRSQPALSRPPGSSRSGLAQVSEKFTKISFF